MDITLFDYGVGNIHSIRKALENEGVTVQVAEDPKALLDSDVVVLPGVGAFGKVAQSLTPVRAELKQKMEQGLPCLAICIGMHVLYEGSEESPGQGLALLSGTVRRLDHARLPHIGWNTLQHPGQEIFEGLPRDPHFYFVHSFAPSPCTEATVATSEYGRPFASVVRRNNVWGMQFHPEKSSDTGRHLIRNFLSRV